MNSKVIILTEAGIKLGYGHLMRCLAIAQGLKKKNIDSVFFLRGDSNPENMIDGFEWKNIEWLEKNPDVTGKTVILDSYYADENFCKKIYDQADKVLFIDDFNRIPYPGGMVLNSVLGAEEIDYPIRENIKYLLGPEYHPLRKEFWEVPDKVINPVIKKILVTFGGTDVTNETPQILNMLKEKFPELEKHVIIGKGFLNLDKIEDAADDNTYLIIQPDAEKMKEQMLECDIAISAAGQTIYELARVGIPTFAKKVVENQDINIKNWKKKNFLFGIEDISNIPDYNRMNEICDIGRSIVDGKGVHRIVEILINDQG